MRRLSAANGPCRARTRAAQLVDVLVVDLREPCFSEVAALASRRRPVARFLAVAGVVASRLAPFRVRGHRATPQAGAGSGGKEWPCSQPRVSRRDANRSSTAGRPAGLLRAGGGECEPPGRRPMERPPGGSQCEPAAQDGRGHRRFAVDGLAPQRRKGAARLGQVVTRHRASDATPERTPMRRYPANRNKGPWGELADLAGGGQTARASRTRPLATQSARGSSKRTLRGPN